MPATILTVQEPPGKYPSSIAANGADLTFAAADAVNGNRFTSTGREIVICRNTNAAATARTVTFTSTEDQFNRKGDITAYSIPGDSGATWAVFGPFKTPGWRDGDGYITVTANNAEVVIAVVRLPSLF